MIPVAVDRACTLFVGKLRSIYPSKQRPCLIRSSFLYRSSVSQRQASFQMSPTLTRRQLHFADDIQPHHLHSHLFIRHQIISISMATDEKEFKIKGAASSPSSGASRPTTPEEKNQPDAAEDVDPEAADKAEEVSSGSLDVWPHRGSRSRRSESCVPTRHSSIHLTEPCGNPLRLKHLSISIHDLYYSSFLAC